MYIELIFKIDVVERILSYRGCGLSNVYIKVIKKCLLNELDHDILFLVASNERLSKRFER